MSEKTLSLSTKTKAFFSLLSVAIAFWGAGRALAQAEQVHHDVTYARDVAPILQEKCVHCHRSGGVAPMSFESYESTRPWAPIIAYRTGLRDKPGAMPPWYMEKDIGIQEFRNDMSLSDEQVTTIAAWAESGAPLGNPDDIPPAREFDDSGEWSIRPDLVVRSQDFFMRGGAPDYWGDIEPIKIPLEEDRYVAAMQVREINDVSTREGVRDTVGGQVIVHHLTFVLNSPDENGVLRPRGLSFLTHEVGRNEDYFPDDVGRILPANSEFQSNSLHLHSNGVDTTAYLEIAFEFHPEGYKPKYTRTGGHGGFGAPGNTVDMDVRPNTQNQEMHAYTVLTENTMILSFEPHLHAPGVRMCLEAIWGSKTEILNCVGYDHTWVRSYSYGENAAPLLPKGTIVHLIGYNDSTRANPNIASSENWIGGGNRSVSNMFLELGHNVRLTDEEFLTEMQERVEALDLQPGDYVIGCPLCGALVAPTTAQPGVEDTEVSTQATGGLEVSQAEVSQ